MEKTEALKSKIKGAMFYPIAVIVVAFVITCILMIFVIPQFQDLFSGFGADLPARLQRIRPGERLLVKFQLESTEQTLAVVASEITVASRTERLVSLLNIQSELDGMQLTAWQDLVRVLTHEIMNSITPVSSLARTASDLIDDVSTRLSGDQSIIAELDDVKSAVSTVAIRIR